MISDGGKAVLRLTREGRAWRDSLRAYHVLIDGERAGKVRRGQTLELPIVPGVHEIYMGISWCRSPVIKVEAHPGELIKLFSLARFFTQAEPAQRRSAGPILLLQGSLDLVVPQLLTDQLDTELCALGDVVQYRTYPEADHDGLLRAAFPALSGWLRARLAGRPAPQGCRS